MCRSLLFHTITMNGSWSFQAANMMQNTIKVVCLTYVHYLQSLEVIYVAMSDLWIDCSFIQLIIDSVHESLNNPVSQIWIVSSQIRLIWFKIKFNSLTQWSYYREAHRKKKNQWIITSILVCSSRKNSIWLQTAYTFFELFDISFFFFCNSLWIKQSAKWLKLF